MISISEKKSSVETPPGFVLFCDLVRRVSFVVIGSGLLVGVVACCVAGGAEALEQGQVALLCAMVGGGGVAGAIGGMAIGSVAKWARTRYEARGSSTAPETEPPPQPVKKAPPKPEKDYSSGVKGHQTLHGLVQRVRNHTVGVEIFVPTLDKQGKVVGLKPQNQTI